MLKFPDTSEFAAYFTEVVTFANKMGLLGQLVEMLQYLNTYGHDPQRPERTTRCELASDFAPYSFRYMMYRVEQTPDGVKEEFWFNGGLIYQGPEAPGDGSFPSLNVSLNSSIGWVSHT